MEHKDDSAIELEDHYQLRRHMQEREGRFSPSSEGAPVKFFWQLLGSVCSAAVVGLFFWLWNVSLDIRDLQNVRGEVARAVVMNDASRVIIDRNSDRLTKIEALLEQFKENNLNDRDVAEALRTEIRSVRDALNAQIVEFSRLAEIVRQLERILQSRFGESAMPQNYQPWPRPPPDRK